MDKITLTKEQLIELKKFINSRGFREPLIVMEILDHFACLVEEKLEANPGMSLDEAMLQAHGSFGVMGFRTIADAADVERNKKLNREFRKILVDMMRSPAIWLLLILAGSIYYTTYIKVQPIVSEFGFARFLAVLPSVLIMLIGQGMIAKRHPGIRNRYVSGRGTWADNGYSTVVFIVLVSFPGFPEGNMYVWPFAAWSVIYTLLILVYVIALYRTWQSTEQHYRDIEQMYAELDTQ